MRAHTEARLYYVVCVQSYIIQWISRDKGDDLKVIPPVDFYFAFGGGKSCLGSLQLIDHVRHHS
jgi:hypothetical protein